MERKPFLFVGLIVFLAKCLRRVRVEGMKSSIILYVGFIALCFSCADKNTRVQGKERLGKAIFFDASLSEPAGQSCATCHTPENGFADKYSRMVSEGAAKGLFSNRNSMSCSYAAYVPALSYDEEEKTYVGGLFWDGRVNSLEEQATKPFTNPLEMGNKTLEDVVRKARQAVWYPEFVRVYGDHSSPDTIFTCINEAIAVYERSVEVNPFTSKFDAWEADAFELTDQEKDGYDLFKEEGKCAECHILDKDVRAGRILLTDHTYDNLGIPSNPENPFFNVPAPYNICGADTIDLGLGSFLKNPAEYGKFRVPTLRNITLTAPYGHNGYFKTLEEIVHFYNVRDIEDFPPAEYPATVNTDELGNLGLSPEDETAIVAFLKTLTDGYRP